MAYTVTQLIANAYYLSGIVSRGLQTVSGEDLNDGLELLNKLLSIKSIDKRKVPFYTEHNFTALEGVETYFIENLIEAETLTFYIGDIRYSMLEQTRNVYNGAGRVENTESLPYIWKFERCKDGANISMYFLPNVNYPCTLWGKFKLGQVTLGTDLNAQFELNYIVYLEFGLAQYICQFRGKPVLPFVKEQIAVLEKIYTDISPKDLSMTKFSSLQRDSGINYADVNIGRGWRP
jgi:hypothetical protein